MKNKIISMLLASAMALSLSAPISASAQTSGIYDSTAIICSANAPSKITLPVSRKTVYIGQKYTISVKSVSPSSASRAVTWKSSDSSVASVSASGVITGKSSGTAVITAVSKENKKIKASCTVTVKDYGKKKISYETKVISYEAAEEPAHAFGDSIVIINSCKERDRQIHFIRNNYPDYNSYRKVILELKKYDEEFFKEHSLIYCRTITYGHSAEFTKASVRDCLKKYSCGKLTAYIKTDYVTNIPDGIETDCMIHTVYNCFVTAVDKSDIKNVENFKIVENFTGGIYPKI